MSVPVILNGVTYELPETGEIGWGDVVTSYLQAVSTGVLSKASGLFTLTQDVNFGASYGVLSKYFKTRSSNPAQSGVVRLSNAEAVGWRLADNSADRLLTMNASGQLTFNGVVIGTGSALTAADVANVPSGNLTATNVQTALYELQGDIDGYAAAVKTFTNKTMSGASNTFTNIPVSALASVATAATPNTLVLRDGSGNITANVGNFDDSITVANQIHGDEIFGNYVEVGSSGLYVNGTTTMIGAATASAFVSDDLGATAGHTLTLTGNKADAVGNEGVVLKTAGTWATNGAKPIVFKSGANTLGWWGVFGDLTIGNLCTASGFAGGALYGSSTTNPVWIQGGMPNGATAIAARIYSPFNYTTAGAKLLTVDNNTDTKFSVDKDGGLGFQNSAATFKYISASSQFVIDRSVSITNGPGNATLYADYVEVTNDLSVYGQGYVALGLSTDPTAQVATGTVAADTHVPNQQDAIVFLSNSVAGAVGTDFLFSSTSTRVAGTLMSIQNNNTAKFQIGWDGQMVYGVSAVGDSTSSPGNATLNTPTGRSKVAASASSITITNGLIASGNAHVAAILVGSDATAKNVTYVTASAGSFTINLNAAATAAVEVRWTILHAG